MFLRISELEKLKSFKNTKFLNVWRSLEKYVCLRLKSSNQCYGEYHTEKPCFQKYLLLKEDVRINKIYPFHLLTQNSSSYNRTSTRTSMILQLSGATKWNFIERNKKLLLAIEKLLNDYLKYSVVYIF